MPIQHVSYSAHPLEEGWDKYLGWDQLPSKGRVKMEAGSL